MVNETITFGEGVMRFDRLQLLAAISFLAVVNACAPNAVVNDFAKVSSASSQTEVDKVEADQPVSFNLPESANSDVDSNSAMTVDGHFGMWFNDWSGVALDGPFFQADGNGLINTAVSATPLLLLRIRLLKSSRVPNGQLQPYFGIGPGIFFTNQKADFQRDIDGKLDTAHMSVGVDLRAGMRWQLSSKLDFFGEYRMTHYKGDRDNHDKAEFLSKEDGDVTLTTNNFMGGLRFTF